MTKKIGLTGSIGMGKSFVADIFRELNIPVFDADKAAHDVVKPNSLAFSKVAASFPEAIVNGEINRVKLGSIVFSDKEKLNQLEAITHPTILSQMLNFIKANESYPIVILEIPLLFELKWNRQMDKVIVVSAPEEIQKARVLSRPNMSEDILKEIIALQMPYSQKLKYADIILNTNQDRLALKEEIIKIIEKEKE